MIVIRNNVVQDEVIRALGHRVVAPPDWVKSVATAIGDNNGNKLLYKVNNPFLTKTFSFLLEVSRFHTQ